MLKQPHLQFFPETQLSVLCMNSNDECKLTSCWCSMSEVLFCMCFLREISVSCLDLLARHPVRRVFPNAVWSGHCRLLVGEVSPYFHGGPRDPRPAAVPRLRAAALVCAPHPVRGEGEGGARAGGESYHRLTAPTPPCCCAPRPRRFQADDSSSSWLPSAEATARVYI
ncbi:uncharacterized protein LOC124596651 [Schistocerca americana]|uniref:uncharacterized protein LOC124596651 n=1 Tax=Schistocerca americana TaxID=7009 RepID=UPI001F50009A|nr:uncharacterized protein LOC124596651 [Schistocerca americana]